MFITLCYSTKKNKKNNTHMKDYSPNLFPFHHDNATEQYNCTINTTWTNTIHYIGILITDCTTFKIMLNVNCSESFSRCNCQYSDNDYVVVCITILLQFIFAGTNRCGVGGAIKTNEPPMTPTRVATKYDLRLHPPPTQPIFSPV